VRAGVKGLTEVKRKKQKWEDDTEKASLPQSFLNMQIFRSKLHKCEHARDVQETHP